MSRALITLATAADRARAHDWINKAPAGTRVEYKGPRRTLPQNDRLHAMLTDVATQHRVNGRRYNVADFKMMFLTAYAEETGMEIRYLPAIHRAGMIPSGRSSSDLSVKEMSELIEFMMAWGAENGVIWTDPQTKEQQRETAA